MADAGYAPIPSDIQNIFVKGAYVIAAYQFLTLHAECDFVDGEGNPHLGYENTAERIIAFAVLGAAVVKRYREVLEQSETSS